jgi:phage repressor protein C with HTH and peptisase S24 domain
MNQSVLARKLRDYLTREGISGRALSKRVGNNESLVKSILKGNSKHPRSDTLAKLAAAMGITVAELTGEASVPHMTPKTNAILSHQLNAPNVGNVMPVYGAAAGGADGAMALDSEPIEYKPRPENLKTVAGAFAVYIVNDSMSPAYEPGDQVNIHPARPVVPGKDALFIRVEPDGTQHALVKRLLKATDKVWRVRQYNPPKDFDLPRNVWQRALRVVGLDRAE